MILSQDVELCPPRGIKGVSEAFGQCAAEDMVDDSSAAVIHDGSHMPASSSISLGLDALRKGISEAIAHNAWLELRQNR